MERSSSSISVINPRHRRLEKFKTFLYNKEDKSFCTKTCKNWCLFILFVLIFYAMVTGVMFAMLWGHRYLFEKEYPGKAWLSKPWFDRGAGVQMFPDVAFKIATGIFFSLKNNDFPSVDEYFENIKTNLEQEEKRIKDDLGDLFNEIFVPCNTTSKRPNKKFSCLFDYNSLGPCAKEAYGFKELKPCIYLTLNKLPQWKPQPFETLPSDLPANAKEEIEKLGLNNEYMWVDCEGVTEADKEHLGEVKYYPHRGLDSQFYPYTDLKHFISPIVAIKLDNVQPGHLIEMTCGVLAENIPSGRNKIQIYIYIDPNSN